INAQDANAVVAAMGKQFNPRALKAGQSFDLTYSVANPIATIDATGQTQQHTTVVRVNKKPVVVTVVAEDEASATEENSESISRLLSLHFSPTIDKKVTGRRTP